MSGKTKEIKCDFRRCKCGIVLTKKGRYCNLCHAAYMRDWRKTNVTSDEERKKGIVRSTTKMLVKRGKLIKGPCEICGDDKVEAHHEDYNDPKLIRWLCFNHHREHHNNQRHENATKH